MFDDEKLPDDNNMSNMQMAYAQNNNKIQILQDSTSNDKNIDWQSIDATLKALTKRVQNTDVRQFLEQLIILNNADEQEWNAILNIENIRQNPRLFAYNNLNLRGLYKMYFCQEITLIGNVLRVAQQDNFVHKQAINIIFRRLEAIKMLLNPINMSFLS